MNNLRMNMFDMLCLKYDNDHMNLVF